jgi:hypothetical protein
MAKRFESDPKIELYSLAKVLKCMCPVAAAIRYDVIQIHINHSA